MTAFYPGLVQAPQQKVARLNKYYVSTPLKQVI